MAEVDEALSAKNPMAADLAVGVEAIAQDQEITFTQYVRLVLPLDGYVFWVKSNIVAPSALYNAAGFNRVRYGQPPVAIPPAAPTLTIVGSLHFSSDIRQEAAETYAANRVVFTAEDEVNDLDDIAPGTLWIGEFRNFKFAFSSQSSRYYQAGLWHYVGFAVYPDMLPQIIDSPAGFDSKSVVVSNSLPAWLALNGNVPPYGFQTGVTLYPSFLVPQNLEPPFGAVDIPPELTIALAAAPTIDPRTSTHTQLCKDTVRITLWGMRNFSALDFIDAVYQYSVNFGTIGIMNMPVIRDEKRTQAELGTIAMKKSVEFEVSYLQQRMNTIARQIIKTSIPNFYVNNDPA
jgi:hypothetical protein